MGKYYTAFILMALMVSPMAMAQRDGSGGYAASIGASAGYVEDGAGGNATFNFHLDRHSYLQLGLFAGFSKETYSVYEIPYSIIAFQPGYFRRLAFTNWDRPLSVYIGGGPLAGYEVINNGSDELPDGSLLTVESSFIYGGFGAVELEQYLSDDLSVAIRACEHFHANSDLGNWYPFIGASIRYYLY